MNIIEMMKEGLRIARTVRALWLYGFFVGLGTLVNSGNKGHPLGQSAVHAVPHAAPGQIAVVLIAAVVALAACVFMYFVSQGALIEGVTSVRRGTPPTVHAGWRFGLAHWGVLFRLGVIFIAVAAASLLILALPGLLALKLSGSALAIALAIPALLIAVPWLATVYMWQQFAARIAVLENRNARDAMAKARLFLHGRLLQGLKLIIAAILGRLVVMVLGTLAIGAVVVLGVAVLKGFGMLHAPVPVILLGAVFLLPMAFILIAVSGTTQSSIWTIGYLNEQGR